MAPRKPVYITVALERPQDLEPELHQTMTTGKPFYLRRRSQEHGTATFEIDKVLQMPSEHGNLVCRGYRVEEGATD